MVLPALVPRTAQLAAASLLMVVACSPATTSVDRADSTPGSAATTPEATIGGSSLATGSGAVTGADLDEAPGPVEGRYPPVGGTVGQGAEARIAGTDSAPAMGAGVAPDLVTTLEDFGRRYLSYDYRLPEATRIEALRPLVTPELLALLARPMPAALVESLAQEQRIVTAEPVEVAAVDTGVYALTFRVHSTAVAATPQPATGEEEEETRTLIVTVDGTQLVSDVR